MQTAKNRLTLDDYAKGVLQGNRVMLGKAITLVESNLESDQKLASALLEQVISSAGNAMRIGITGVPGVGKSTFIEAFGKHVTSLEKKMAVLTIDPSSQLTKGSILGDKTRMEELSKNPMAFIRPSASGNKLGGVANRTRESMLLCEAAGFEVIIIETVGVGQSEVAVKDMTDFFLLLMLAGAGDELQGIKKGIMEMADAVVITKADGNNIQASIQAQAEYQHALHLLSASTSGWITPVLTCSAESGNGIEEVWKIIAKYKDQTKTSGFFNAQRSKQNIKWFHENFDQLLRSDFLRVSDFQNELNNLETKVADLSLSPQAAASALLNMYHNLIYKSKS